MFFLFSIQTQIEIRRDAVQSLVPAVGSVVTARVSENEHSCISLRVPSILTSGLKTGVQDNRQQAQSNTSCCHVLVVKMLSFVSKVTNVNSRFCKVAIIGVGNMLLKDSFRAIVR